MVMEQNAQQKSLPFQVKSSACTFQMHQSPLGLKKKKKRIMCLILSELPDSPFCVLWHRKMLLIRTIKDDTESRKRVIQLAKIYIYTHRYKYRSVHVYIWKHTKKYREINTKWQDVEGTMGVLCVFYFLLNSFPTLNISGFQIYKMRRVIGS